MTSLHPSEVFSSRAHYLVLEALESYQVPSSLRNLESLTGLRIRSIQLAVESLEKMRLIERHKKCHCWEIQLSPKFKKEQLSVILTAARDRALLLRAQKFSRVACQVLKWNQDTISLVESATASRPSNRRLK